MPSTSCPWHKWAWGLRTGAQPSGDCSGPHGRVSARDLLSVSWTSGLTHDSHPRQQGRSRVRPSTPPGTGRRGAGFTHSSCRLQARSSWGPGLTPQEAKACRPASTGSPGSRPTGPEPEKGGRRHPNLSINTHPSLPRADSPHKPTLFPGATPHHRPLGSPEQEAPRGAELVQVPGSAGLTQVKPEAEFWGPKTLPCAVRRNAHSPRSLPRARRVHMGPSPPQGPTGGLPAEVEGQPGPQAQPERTGTEPTLPEAWQLVRSCPGPGQPQAG